MPNVASASTMAINNKRLCFISADEAYLLVQFLTFLHFRDTNCVQENTTRTFSFVRKACCVRPDGLAAQDPE